MSENNIAKSGWRDDFDLYFDRRMWRILLLGFMSGFPWVLIATALTLWLKEDGLSRSTIGWAGLIFGVYALNWMWAPLIDRIRIPFLTDKIGHRKSWILTMQSIMLISLILWSLVNPVDNLKIVIFIGLIIAISSATQDITIDALRIEQIGEHEQGSIAAGAAVAVVGWWSGYKLGGMIALVAAGYFEKQGITNYWQMTFILLSAIIVICNIFLAMIPEASVVDRQKAQLADEKKLGVDRMPGFVSWFVSTILSPMTSFFRKNGVSIGIAILSFIFLFKIGEAFMGKMSIVFYKEIGFSKSDIAVYSKGLGWVTTVVFTIIGGWVAMRAGSVKALFLAGIAMAATNIMFSFLAWSGKSEVLFAVAVIFDDMAAAFATVAFVAFISRLVDRTYTATQYALLASLGTLGRTLLASSSGAMVDALDGDWGIFFIITALMVIPSLILLWFLRNKIAFETAPVAVSK
jgi:PAT family beta-lactamase induction signal transducer AmpG